MSASVNDWKYLNPSLSANWPAPNVAPMDDTYECCCEFDCLTPYDRLSPWSFVWAPPTHR